MAPIVGNRAVEDAAVAWVIELERLDSRTGRDTRSQGPGDVSSPPRTIEVKAYGKDARGQNLWLETRQVTAALTDPEFWIYVVENVAQSDPATFRVARLGGDRLATLLERRREQHYFLMPWPVADYDANPPTVATGDASRLSTTLQGFQLPTRFSDRPKMHKDPDFRAAKQARLRERHVAPINGFVDQIRADRQATVPYVDPDSRGVAAKVLFVLESPARPAAIDSGMLSADNNDETARNVWDAYTSSGMPRTFGLHWNAVPWFIGDNAERNVTRAQVAAGHGYLMELLDLAPDIRVVVAFGKPAQESIARIAIDLHARGITVLECLHPSPRNNARGAKEVVPEIFRRAYEIARQS